MKAAAQKRFASWADAIRMVLRRVETWVEALRQRPRMPANPRPTVSGQTLRPPAEMQLQAAAMAACSNAMFITDRNGRIEWVNPAFSRLSGYPAQDAVGRTPRILKSGHQSQGFYRDLWRTIRTGRAWRGRLVNRKRNGELYDVEQTVSPIRDARGAVTHFLAVHEDIAERLRTERRLVQQAMLDSLTNLPNRTVFRQRIVDAMARAKRSGRFVAVLFLDLDRFKAVNDKHGHATGDALLAQVAGRLTTTLRQTDMAARLGGDEFAVVVEELDLPTQAAGAARRLLAALKNPIVLDHKQLQIGASIGIAVYPNDQDSPEILLQHADAAMYAAKSLGRGQFRFFDVTVDAAAQRPTL